MSAGLAVLGAFIRRDWRIDLSYRAAFAMSLFSSVLTLALFFFLGEVIDDAEFATDEGIDGGYFGFVAIGIAIFTIVQSAMISFSRKLREEQTTGTFEALMATPPNLSLAPFFRRLRDPPGPGQWTAVDRDRRGRFDLRFDTSATGVATAVLALLGTLLLFAALGVAIGALTVLFKRATAIVGLLMSAIAVASTSRSRSCPVLFRPSPR